MNKLRYIYQMKYYEVVIENKENYELKKKKKAESSNRNQWKETVEEWQTLEKDYLASNLEVTINSLCNLGKGFHFFMP